jgi:hypothetical protein
MQNGKDMAKIMESCPITANNSVDNEGRLGFGSVKPTKNHAETIRAQINMAFFFEIKNSKNKYCK